MINVNGSDMCSFLLFKPSYEEDWESINDANSSSINMYHYLLDKTMPGSANENRKRLPHLCVQEELYD
jgi:hypothetical protein